MDAPPVRMPAARELTPLGAFVLGFLPLLLLLGVWLLTIVSNWALRALFASGGFYQQQTVSLVTFGCGLVLSLLVYGLAIGSVLHRVNTWQGSVQRTLALAAFWMTALFVLLPVVLAIVLPQHPSP